MNPADIRLLIDYNVWANARVLAATARLSPEQFAAPAGLSFGSLHGTLAHILAAENVWRLRCQEGVSPAALLAESDVPTLEALRQRWAAEQEALGRYAATLTAEALQGTIQYRTTRGGLHQDVLAHLLIHVVNHGTQFRSEAAVALTRFGHSPGDLDLIYFMRHKEETA
ncbi:MAG TPA: DinB family protein [Anaerolineales bacterium]